MLNKQEQIDRIKKRLAPTQADEILLSDLFDDRYQAAVSAANRQAGDDNPALLAIVREQVVAAYNRIGNEGMSSQSTGGQSEAYEDLDSKLLRAVVSANLRRFRP